MSAKNKPEVVVVTGSSAGVGRAIAHAFAKRGAHVGLLARGQEGLDDAAREVESFGGQALGVPTDVADHHQVEAAAQKVEEHFGDIDVWVNDAMATVLARFLDTKPEEFKRATEVTYLGAVYGTMAALRRMTARDRGKIVQVGSALAYRAIPLQAAYCGAKFGIRGFTDSIRTELLHDKSKVQITMVQLNWGSTPPSSTGVDQSCPTTRCRSPRYTSPRSRPRRSTGLPTITAASCGWATAPCWRSWATRSPPASPTGTWARAGSAASRSAICRSALSAPTTCSSRCRTRPRTACSTTRPRSAARSCGRPPTAPSSAAAIPASAPRGSRRGKTHSMSPASPGETARAAGMPHVLLEYALLADGERGVLVGPRGDFAWMCFPRWDSSAVFSSLIGGAGAYAVTPQGRYVWGGYYEPGSLIWHSRWVTSDATIECREALALPSHPDRAVILRRVTALTGTARVDVVLNPRGDFGHGALHKLRQRDDGAWTGELGDAHMCWTGGQDAAPHPDGKAARP